MDFYLIFVLFYRPFPPRKWVTIIRTVEGSFEKVRLLQQHPMDSAPRPTDIFRVIGRSGVPQREGQDAFTGAHPVSTSLQLANLIYAPKKLSTSALTASDSPRRSSTPSPPPPSPAATLHNI